jgi:O-antigen/teichoic acid export membrane protein
VGVIQRQGIKDSIVAYFGVALGALNSLFIYPLLPSNVLGLFSFLVSAGMLIGTLLQVGMPNVSLRFFSTFRTDDNRHNGFLFLLLSPSVIGFILFVIAAILLAPTIRAKMIAEDMDPLLPQFLFFLIPMSIFVAFNMILAYYIKNFLRIVIPTLLENVWVKIATGGLSLLFAYSFISLTSYVTGIVLAYGVVTLGLFVYARWLGQLHLRPNFTFLNNNRPLLRQIGIFALYGILGSVGGNLMTQIDRTMIPLLMGEQGATANGIFTIVAYIGTTIDIPRKSLERIASPTVAHAIAQNDWVQVADLYKRSSINLFVIGTLLFLGIWLNLDSVFAIMSQGEKYLPYKNIVFILGIASLIDMVTSINTPIISYSRYFRFAFYVIVVLAGLNIGFNYLFIKTFGLGITGAALATLISITVYNIAKFLFIYRKFHLQPFRIATLWVLLIAVGVYGIVSLLPSTGIAIVDILYKSSIITVLYLLPIFYFKLSPDLNQLLLRFWQPFRKWLRL